MKQPPFLKCQKAIDIIMDLAEKAEKYDQICAGPTTPSGMKQSYLKPQGKRHKY